jgi:TfoX/Sxy family transcriptional regulator of competence genes
MRLEKPPPSLVALFEARIAGTGAERRSMFGQPCAFSGGNMCAGLFGDALFVRLGEAERGALLALPGARPFEPMPGRPMREYVVVPPSMRADAAALDGWIAKAVAYAGGLPAKGKKGKRKPTRKAPKRGKR